MENQRTISQTSDYLIERLGLVKVSSYLQKFFHVFLALNIDPYLEEKITMLEKNGINITKFSEIKILNYTKKDLELMVSVAKKNNSTLEEVQKNPLLLKQHKIMVKIIDKTDMTIGMCGAIKKEEINEKPQKVVNEVLFQKVPESEIEITSLIDSPITNKMTQDEYEKFDCISEKTYDVLEQLDFNSIYRDKDLDSTIVNIVTEDSGLTMHEILYTVFINSVNLDEEQLEQLKAVINFVLLKKEDVRV